MLIHEVCMAYILSRMGQPSISFYELRKIIRKVEQNTHLGIWHDDSDIYNTIITMRDKGYLLWDKKRKIIQPLPGIQSVLENQMLIVELLAKRDIQKFKIAVDACL
ncbi:MAG: hypothetical protein DRN49_00075 [Thaumarchaeota archaeon]|nr:MAG: hypothetical protein DRN49_00075 [Nitrososphaerota archaeon]